MNFHKSDFLRKLASFAFLAFVVCVCSSDIFAQADSDDKIIVNTDLIQTNVTVVDKNNRLVEGLKKEQFELRVDGKSVPIEFFNQVISNRANNTAAAQTNSPDPIPANDAPSFLRARRIVFFVDDLHLSLDSMARTRSTITHFVDDEMKPRDNVLIVSASGQLGFLQQFTNSKPVLRAAVARLKPIPFTPRDTEPPPMPEFTALRILNGDKEVADYYVEQIFKGFNVKNLKGINYAGALEMVRNRANNIVSALVSVSETSLGSLESLLQNLNQTGGRKLIFFASDGFFLGAKNNSPVDNVRLQRVIDLATRSGSVLYTIDARGLFSLSADATGERPFDPQGRFDRGRVSEEMLGQEALFSLAEETGGKFLKNQNYFDKWVDKSLDENANYYIIAWSPEAESPGDKKFKRVEVSVVGRPDLTVRLQRGYLTGTVANEGKSKENKKENNPKKNAETVALQVAPIKSVGKNLPLILSLNYLDVPNVGAVLTSSVQVETAALDYGSNNQAANIDVAGVVFNEQGKQVADFKTGLNISPAQTGKEQGVIYNARTPLAPGLYQVKIGAREGKSGRTGASAQWIEIPDLTKKKITLGSLLLGATEVKKAEKPDESSQAQFSVDHSFPRPLKLDFLTFIYNAAKPPNGEVNLATKIEVFNEQGQTIVSTPLRPLQIRKIDDYARIPFAGVIKQGTTAPGNYLLKITVKDMTSETIAEQQTIFTIQ